MNQNQSITMPIYKLILKVKIQKKKTNKQNFCSRISQVHMMYYKINGKIYEFNEFLYKWCECFSFNLFN